MTDRARTASSRARPGLVALVLAVLASVLLWTGAGNTFAAHMGSVADVAAPTASSGEAPRQGDLAPAATRRGNVPHDAESSHVLHLLGGCIAVLGAALLLAGAGGLSPAGTASSGSRPVERADLERAVRLRRRPPPLSPPTTSPVLRT